jgi:hypothetical protein
VLVYFDNGQKAAAPKDAERLRALLDGYARSRRVHPVGAARARPRLSGAAAL